MRCARLVDASWVSGRSSARRRRRAQRGVLASGGALTSDVGGLLTERRDGYWAVTTLAIQALASRTALRQFARGGAAMHRRHANREEKG